MAGNGLTTRFGAASLALFFAWGLAACGGDDAGPSVVPPPVAAPEPAASAPAPTPEPPAPTPLPASLSIDAPDETTPGLPLAFSSNLASPADGLQVEWTFGDGSTSQAPAPSKAYSSAGLFNVVLTVRNAAGASVTAGKTVRVASIVPGTVRCTGANRTGWCKTTVSPDVSFFLDANRAFGLSDDGLLFTSTDGGLHWTTSPADLDGVRFHPFGRSEGRVAFADASVGWALGIDAASPAPVAGGANPVLIRTEDGGHTWRRQSTQLLPVDSGLLVLDRQRAVVGRIGRGLIYTRDGGASWSSGPTLPDALGSAAYDDAIAQALYRTSRHAVSVPTLPDDLVFIDASHRLARVRDWGTVVDTVLETEESLRSLSFADARNGWLVGMATVSQQPTLETPRLWRTTDGGASWTAVATRGLPERVDPSAAVVRFFPGGTGWLDLSPSLGCCGNGLAERYRPRVFRTVDGGQNWQEVAFPTSAGTNIGVAVLGPDLAFTRPFRPLPPPDIPLPGLVVNDQGRHVSRDGGQSWLPLPDGPLALPRYADRFAVDPLSSLGGDRVLRTSGQGLSLSDDAGFTWTSPFKVSPVRTGSLTVATASWQFDPQREIVQLVSSKTDFSSGDKGSSTLAETRDGGLSWSYTDEPGGWGLAPDGGHGARIQFVSARVGWRHKDSRTLQRTDDGGASWTTLMLPAEGLSGALTTFNLGPGDFQFTDTQTGWLVGEMYDSFDQNRSQPHVTDILRTMDGGLTWSKTRTQGRPRAIHFRDRLHGVAVGCTADITVTSDGGVTWATRQAPKAVSCLNRVAWLDDLTIVAVGQGGAVMRSVDGGSTWTQVATGTTANLVDLAMADASNGWVVGTGGTVLATTDGGQSWSLQPVGSTEDLIEVRALGSGNVSILGTNGGRFVTETAGR